MPAKSPSFPDSVLMGKAQVLNATGTATVTLVTAGGSGARIDTLALASDDTVAREVQFSITDAGGGAPVVFWTVSVPIGAGQSAAVPPVNALSRSACAFLNDDGALILPATVALLMNTSTVVTAAKKVSGLAMGAGFSA